MRKLSSLNKLRSTLGSQRRGVFDLEIVEERSGIVVLRVSGARVYETFKAEAGGHRFQRVPPNEKRGRVHTSTITIAVLNEPTDVELTLDSRDLEITTCRGTGPGGQNRNKTESAVQVRHIPTGIIVRCDRERSQSSNKASALAVLRARLLDAQRAGVANSRAELRRNQLGRGARGDKRRTIAIQRDSVIDHVTGREWRYRDYARGDWD